jgi:hypothetical protein
MMNREFTLLRINTIWNERDSIQLLRLYLSTLPPYECLRLLLDPAYESERLPQITAYFRGKFSNKRKLLQWIYGESDRRLTDYTDWQNIRRASRSKRAFVSQLSADVRQRYTWITPRVIHAFAFRQSFFANPGFRNWPHGKELYARVKMPKARGGTRTLDVPIAPLRRLQRSILRLCLDRAQETLPDAVTGARRRRYASDVPFNIYRNAAAHVGQRFVASFDLANFFPSIRVGVIIQALQNLAVPICLDSDQSPLPWTHDAAVLVARLLTHRGRLPQGAPTSPAIANLVFHRHDDEIMSRLGKDFIYTRYFDDITISISAKAARSHSIQSPKDLRRIAETALATAIRNSDFRINQAKTRATSIDRGHRVTGLRVTQDRVTLPRRTRRELSALLHQIRRDGFDVAAMRHVENSVIIRTTFDGVRDHHLRKNRRLSTERLAVMMLRIICPNLRVEVPGQAWALGPNRIVVDDQLHEGSEALNDIERLLTRIWKGELRVHEDGGHFVVSKGNQQTVARVRCEKNGEFLLLTRRQAVVTIEMWHRLHGWAAGLNPGDRDDCFAAIDQLRGRIAGTLDAMSLSPPSMATPEVETVPETGDNPFSLLGGGVGEAMTLAPKVLSKYLDFYHYATDGQHPSVSAAQEAADIAVAVTSRDQLKSWLHSARKLFIDELPRLPLTDPEKPNQDVADLLRILDDRIQELRCPGYEIEKHFLKRHIRKQNVEEIDDQLAIGVQLPLLQKIDESLTKSLNARNQQAQETWLQAQRRNFWRIPHDRLLREQYRDFTTAHDQARWITTGKPVFTTAAKQEIAEGAGTLSEQVSAETSRDVWKELFYFCNVVASATGDCLSGDENTFSTTVKESLKKRGKSPDSALLYEQLNHDVGEYRTSFEVVFLMRCRNPHPEDVSQIDEWNRIQKFAAKLLRRRFAKPGKRPPGETLFGPGDLQLTSLEGTEIKLHLLQEVTAGLKQMRCASE